MPSLRAAINGKRANRQDKGVETAVSTTIFSLDNR